MHQVMGMSQPLLVINKMNNNQIDIIVWILILFYAGFTTYFWVTAMQHQRRRKKELKELIKLLKKRSQYSPYHPKKQ